MAYRGEHEVREEEARLRATWRWLRRTGAAGTANSVELLVREVAEASERSGGGRRSAAWSGRCRRDRRGAGQAGGAARRARRRMAATRRARSDAAGRVRGGRARRAGAGARRGGRPGRPVRLGRKRGGGPLKEK